MVCGRLLNVGYYAAVKSHAELFKKVLCTRELGAAPSNCFTRSELIQRDPWPSRAGEDPAAEAPVQAIVAPSLAPQQRALGARLALLPPHDHLLQVHHCARLLLYPWQGGC